MKKSYMVLALMALSGCQMNDAGLTPMATAAPAGSALVQGNVAVQDASGNQVQAKNVHLCFEVQKEEICQSAKSYLSFPAAQGKKVKLSKLKVRNGIEKTTYKFSGYDFTAPNQSDSANFGHLTFKLMPNKRSSVESLWLASVNDASINWDFASKRQRIKADRTSCK